MVTSALLHGFNLANTASVHVIPSSNIKGSRPFALQQMRTTGQTLIILVALLLCAPVAAQWFKEQQAIMGTVVIVELWHEDAAMAQRCIATVMAEMRRINAAMSPYRESSELSRLNRDATQHPVAVSKELYTLLQRALEVSRLSNGAFDITFASVGYLYDYRQKQRPSRAALQSSLPAVNYQYIQLLPDYQVHFTHPGVRIDLGGIAKGHAVDNGIRLLKQCGIREALVSAGGDSRIIGDRHGRPWITGIRQPRRAKGNAVLLPLSDTAFSTSGDYERYFIEDGVRYHHILNPETGASATGTWSTTVLGPDATTTDALSTTLFVLGPDKAMQLVESLAGIEAIIIDDQGQVHYSSGLLDPATSSN